MNDTTKRIAEECGWPIDTHIDDPHQIVGPQFAEKFSQAIIKEACRYLEERSYVDDTVGYDITARAMRVAVLHLKDRFGVKL